MSQLLEPAIVPESLPLKPEFAHRTAEPLVIRLGALARGTLDQRPGVLDEELPGQYRRRGAARAPGTFGRRG